MRFSSMTNAKNKTLFFSGTFIATASILMLFATGLTQQETISFAESENDGVNNVHINTVFKFIDGTEEVNTFKVFKQYDGYGESTNPSFELQGIVDGRHPLLYNEAHTHHHQRDNPSISRDFDVSVYLQDGAVTDVHFLYTSCDIIDYYVQTAVDVNLKVWNGDAKFPHVEHFVFECNGIHPFHQIDDQRDNPEYRKQPTITTDSTSEEESSETWEDYFK